MWGGDGDDDDDDKRPRATGEVKVGVVVKGYQFDATCRVVRKGLFGKLTRGETWSKREREALGHHGEGRFKQGSQCKGPEASECVCSSRNREYWGPADRGTKGQTHLQKKCVA